MDLAVVPTSHTVYVESRVFYQVLPTCGFYDNVGVFATPTLTQTASTHVGSAFNFAQIAVNQTTGHVYAEDNYDDTVTVLDGSGNVLHQITLPTHPNSLAVNATTNKIYVTELYGNGIIVIDGAIDSVIRTITDPNIVFPGIVAANPATNAIYVSNTQSCNGCPIPDSIAVIDGASDSVTGTIAVGSGPGDIAVDPQTNFIYVTHGVYNNKPGSVTVINGATKATSTLTDPSLVGPFRAAVNPATNKIYVANSGNNNITVIDGAHN
jgi:DNA-binding beta-propeller fold protein YncE